MSAFFEAAAAIARRICRDAIWADGSCNWMGPFVDSWNMWDIRQRSFGPDLYSGTSGVALFLASVARMEDDRLIRKTAEGAARHGYQHAGEFPPSLRISVYSGRLGVAWALIRAGDLLDAFDWQERGLALGTAAFLRNQTITGGAPAKHQRARTGSQMAQPSEEVA